MAFYGLGTIVCTISRLMVFYLRCELNERQISITNKPREFYEISDGPVFSFMYASTSQVARLLSAKSTINLRSYCIWVQLERNGPLVIGDWTNCHFDENFSSELKHVKILLNEFLLYGIINVNSWEFMFLIVCLIRIRKYLR